MVQETLKVPKITNPELFEDELLEVLQVDTTEISITPYKAGQYTLIDGNLFCHSYTHPILTCVSGDQCARIMVELYEGICVAT